MAEKKVRASVAPTNGWGLMMFSTRHTVLRRARINLICRRVPVKKCLRASCHRVGKDVSWVLRESIVFNAKDIPL